MVIRHHNRIIHYGLIALVLTLALLPTLLFAATEAEKVAADAFVPLVGIPYVEQSKVATFGDYVNAFYLASISIAAFLAVVKIIFAGVKYMLSDIVTTKGEAKKDIRAAIFGLLLVIGAVLILNTINTDLTRIQLFADAPIVKTENRAITIDQRLYTTDPTKERQVRRACEDRGAIRRIGTIRGGYLPGQTIKDEDYEVVCCLNDGTSSHKICAETIHQQEFDVTIVTYQNDREIIAAGEACEKAGGEVATKDLEGDAGKQVICSVPISVD